MGDEEMQHLWQSQRPPGAGVRDLAALLASTRERHRSFRRTIFWRDFREVGVALMMVPLWCWNGYRSHAGWVWYLMVPALLFIIGFLLIDRRRHRADRPHPDDPVRTALGKALREVEHQIWLLRQVHWWYLGPIAGVQMVISLDRCVHGQQSVRGLVTGLGFTLGLGALIWWFNQYAVRKSLAPRRAELEQLME